MSSSDPSSLALSSSTVAMAVPATMALDDTATSRSSSIRSVRHHNLKSAQRPPSRANSEPRNIHQQYYHSEPRNLQQTYHHQQVYVAPSPDSEVVRQAAVEVIRSNQSEAAKTVEQTKAQAEAFASTVQAEASTRLASFQVEATQALSSQESQLRSAFEERERENFSKESMIFLML